MIVHLPAAFLRARCPTKSRGDRATAESITGFAGMLGIAAWFALLYPRHRAAPLPRRANFSSSSLALVALGIVFDWPGISAVFHFVFRLAANARLRLLALLDRRGDDRGGDRHRAARALASSFSPAS